MPSHLFPKTLPDPDPVELADARRRYEAKLSSMAQIATQFARSPSSMRKIAGEQGWIVPQRSAAPKVTKVKKTVEPSAAALLAAAAPIEPKNIMLGLAQTALRLMNALEQKLATEAASEPDTRMMGNLIKMLGDFRKSGIENGENDLSGALHGNAGAAAAITADDMAGARARLVERFREAAGVASSAEDSGDGV